MDSKSDSRASQIGNLGSSKDRAAKLPQIKELKSDYSHLTDNSGDFKYLREKLGTRQTLCYKAFDMGPTTTDLKIIFGGGALSPDYGTTTEHVTQVLDFLEGAGIKTIDTAQAYSRSEVLLGQANAASRGFTIDTKFSGSLWPHHFSTAENVIQAGKGSLMALRTSQVSQNFKCVPRAYLSRTLINRLLTYSGGRLFLARA